MATRNNPRFGILIPEVLFSSDAEKAQGATSVDSAYTQASPGPGLPTPSDATSPWRTRITGYQDVDVQAIVLHGGYPGLDRTDRPAAAVAVREIQSSPASTDYVGWDDPVTLRGFTSHSDIYGLSATTTIYSTCCVLPDQRIVVFCTTSSGSANKYLSIYDPRQETWESGGTLSGVTFPSTPALAYDTERDILILYGGYGAAHDSATVAVYSRDFGTTWAPYSRGLYDQTTSSGARVTVATQERRPWVMVRANGAGFGQYSSVDRGITWQRVVAASSTIAAGEARVVALKSGAFLIVYVEVTTLDCKCRRLGSANVSFSDATAVMIDTTSTLACVPVVDHDGVVYVYRQDNTTPSKIQCYRSLDEGETWETYTYDVSFGNVAADYPNLDMAVAAAGQVAILHGMTGHASLANSRALLLLGGWSSVESGNAGPAVAYRTERLGFGAYSGAASIQTGRAWHPVELPENYGWVAGVTTGTRSFPSSDPPGMLCACTAGQHLEHYYTAGSGAKMIAGQIGINCTQGSNSAGMKFQLALDDGSYRFQLILYINSTDFRAVDSGGSFSTVSSTISTMATTGITIRAMITHDGAGTGFASVAYREIGGDVWTILKDRASMTNAGTTGAGDYVFMGNGDGTATSATVFHASVAFGSNWSWGLDAASEVLDNPWDSGRTGLRWGRPVSPDRPYPCPVAALTTYTSGSPTDCPMVSATGGPARIAETTTIPVGYGKPFNRVYPSTALSPRYGWVGTDTTEHRVVWDQGTDQETWIGDAVGLCILGSYARQVSLEYWTGAAWTVAGTLDLSISTGTSLTGTLVGRSLAPASGNTVSTYIPEGTLVGGYALISAAGPTTVARVISRQSGGWWDSTSSQPLRLILDGIDGTEDASPTVQIIAPSGVLVVYPTAIQARRAWRVKWAASQVVPGDAYAAGKIIAGRILGVGADPGWDWSRRTEFRRAVDRDRAGQIEAVRELAPPAQVWTYGWTDGLDLYALRSTTTPDYFATSTGLPIAVAEDAIGLLGVMEHSLSSGKTPVVLLPQLPSSSGTTIWDPSLFRYGVLASDSVSISGVVGTEGTDEVIRLDGVAFEEIR